MTIFRNKITVKLMQVKGRDWVVEMSKMMVVSQTLKKEQRQWSRRGRRQSIGVYPRRARLRCR